MKFKVGDKIILIKDVSEEGSNYCCGKEGVIVEINKWMSFPIYVKFGDGSPHQIFKEEELVLSSEAARILFS